MGGLSGTGGTGAGVGGGSSSSTAGSAGLGTGGSSEIVGTASLSTVTYSIIQGGYASGLHIIADDPLFVDVANGDLTLQALSPAIDAGDECASVEVPRYDKNDHGRWDIASKNDTISAIDIGAFEYQGTAGIDTLISVFNCN